MSRSSNIGLFGCSNMYGYHHAFADAVLGIDKLSCLNEYLDEHVYKTKSVGNKINADGRNIENFSFPGVGNKFISSMIEENLSRLDYVFVQFSGLTRIDIKGLIDDWPFTELDWMLSGGLKGSWMNYPQGVRVFNDLYDKNLDSIINANLDIVYDTLALLEAKSIPHNWCFYYDLQKTHELEYHEPIKVKTNVNHVTPDPHTYCYAKGKGADDGCHFLYDGYRDWLYDIKDQLNITL